MYEFTTFSLGTKPVPRIWDKWNFKGLEPKDMRKDEQIKQDASKGVLKASLLKKSTAVDNTSHWRIQGRGPARGGRPLLILRIVCEQSLFFGPI